MSLSVSLTVIIILSCNSVAECYYHMMITGVATVMVVMSRDGRIFSHVI